MEKRREIRIRKRILVRFTHENNTHHSFTADLSPRGMFIQTPYVYPPGMGISIELHLNDTCIPLTGHIVWSKKVPISSYLILKGGMGVQILDNQNPDFLKLLDEKIS
jgi:Tfp pilus assembly protein PilZ